MPAQAQQEISDWHDFANVSEDLDGNYVLVNDLNDTTAGFDAVAGESANGGAGFRPLGSLGAEFTGTFDGQGHTISHYTINRTGENGVGLFGNAGNGSENFTIENLDVGAVTVTGGVNGSDSGDGRVGALVGQAVNGTIQNVSVSGLVSSPIRDANGHNSGGVGGAVGKLRSVDTRDSYANVTVDAPTGRNIGGFAGYVRNSDITRSVAMGNVTGRDSVGGFAGDINTGGSVTESYATGDVTSFNSSGDVGTGGFVGSAWGTATIKKSFATGDVVSRGTEASYYTGSGGFVGLGGFLQDLSITHVYATGSVESGSTSGGGVIGTTSTGNFFVEATGLGNSYWDILSTGQTDYYGGGDGCGCPNMIGYDTDDGTGRADEMTGMDAVGNMSLFDFNNTWIPQTNPDGYPRLRNVTPREPFTGERVNASLSGLDIAGQSASAVVAGGTMHQATVNVTNTGTATGSFAVTFNVSNASGIQVSAKTTTGDVAPNEATAVAIPDATSMLAISTMDYNLTVMAGNATGNGSIAVNPDVNGDGTPAVDTTGDGNLDDIDGDGSSTILDVQALFSALDYPVVQNHPALFEFVDSGTDRVSIFDVQALYAEVGSL